MIARPWRLAAVAVTAALMGWVAWALLRPAPSLAPALQLVESGRFDEARAATLDYLRAAPENAAGLILLARIEVARMDRPDGSDPCRAREALAGVRRARADDPRLAALGRFYEGALCESLMRLDEAEAAWREAVRLNPGDPEPARRLLALLTLQGRKAAARELAMRLYRVGQNVHARLQALQELVAIEVHQPAAVEVINKLTPVVRENPGDLHSALSLGRALVREGQPEPGLAHLRAAVRSHPDDPETLDALLSGLEDAGRVDAVEETLRAARPRPGAEGPLARHRGWVAQERGRWGDAAREYRRALDSTPDDPRLRYRLGRALRLDGDAAEADRLERDTRARAQASRSLRALFESKRGELNDGALHPDLYQQFAELREATGRADEARAWHALALRARPDDPRSLAAIERLKFTSGETTTTRSPVPIPSR